MGRLMTVWQHAPLLVNVCLMNKFNEQTASIIAFCRSKNPKYDEKKRESNVQTAAKGSTTLSDFFHHKLIRESLFVWLRE